MSMTLGEKLRQAREERGISLSEVAEQTRISPLYLESIDKDDYRNLPGGIFNRGFVKSYAKYVGLDEQEALLDYARLQNELESAPAVDQPRTYRPEVLTDDRAGSSNAPTIIMAVVILALMTGGILFLVNYLRKPAEPASNSHTVANTNTAPPANEAAAETPASTSDIAAATFEFKATTQPVKVIVTVDSDPPKPTTIASGSSATFSPKESLTLNYLRWNAAVVQLAINGKQIALPAEPLDPKDKDRIIFTISKDNFAQVLNSGAISQNALPVAQTNTNTEPANTTTQTTPAARPSPAPKASPTANAAQTPKAAPANTQPKPAMTSKPSAPANKPPA